MKTLEILDKYRKILAGIIKCNPEDIIFFKDSKEIGTFDYDKDEVAVNWALGSYIVKQRYLGGYSTIGSFRLYQLQHCCAFMVSCNAVVEKDYRGKRIGTTLNMLRQDIGRLLGYSAILCTDIAQNTYQRQLLKTNGWRDLFSLVNKRTKNTVYLSVISI